jgi:hypothetical protein
MKLARYVTSSGKMKNSYILTSNSEGKKPLGRQTWNGNGKVAPGTHEAPHHEDVWSSGGIAPLFIDPRTRQK